MPDNYLSVLDTLRGKDKAGLKLPVFFLGQDMVFPAGVQTLAVTDAVTHNLAVPPGADIAVIHFDGATSTGFVRYWHGPTDPTASTGIMLVDGNKITSYDPASLTFIKGGSTGGGTLQIEYFSIGGQPPVGAPPTMTITNITASGFTVNWTAVPGAQTYQVWVEPGSIPSGALAPSTLSWAWGGASGSTTYTVKLDVQVNNVWTTILQQNVTTLASPTSFSIAAPGSTGRPITNLGDLAGGYGSGTSNFVDWEDYTIDASGDSGFICGDNVTPVHDITIRRWRMRNIAIHNAVPYGKHGIYTDGWNFLGEDLDIECASPAASGISIRFGNSTVRRFACFGPGHTAMAGHCITFYDSDTGQGGRPASGNPVLFENGSGWSALDTAIWVDAQDNFKVTMDQALTFRNLDLSCDGGWFLKLSTRNRFGTYRIENCKINGVLITSGNVNSYAKVGSTGAPVPNLTVV